MSLLKISQQTFWQLLGKAVTAFSTFIILGLVARNYGEEGTGIFTLVLTYLSIFYLIADFGFNAHVLKEGISNWQKLLGARIIWSLVLVALALISLPFWPFSNLTFSQAVLIGSLTILASGVYISSNLVFQAKLRYDLSVLASSLGTIIGLGVFVYLISLHPALPFLLVEHLTSWMLTATLSWLLLKRLKLNILPKFDFGYISKLFKDSWPLAGTLFLNVVYFRADSFLIAMFRNSSEVGIYNIAYSIFQTALVLPAFIMNAYYPMLLKSFSGAKKVGLTLLALGILGSLLTYLLSPQLILILTGGGFRGSVESLRILSLGFPAFFVSNLLMWVLVTKNKYQRMLVIYLIGLIFNLFLNWQLIPTYSFIAASWITVVSEYLILSLQIVSLLK